MNSQPTDTFIAFNTDKPISVHQRTNFSRSVEIRELMIIIRVMIAILAIGVMGHTLDRLRKYMRATMKPL